MTRMNLTSGARSAQVSFTNPSRAARAADRARRRQKSRRCRRADLQVAERLGFSSRHVVRLVNAGSLEAGRVAGAGMGIVVASVVAFERRRERGRAASDELSRSLDALGAPLE
jgi:hypothetical protein